MASNDLAKNKKKEKGGSRAIQYALGKKNNTSNQHGNEARKELNTVRRERREEKK